MDQVVVSGGTSADWLGHGIFYNSRFERHLVRTCDQITGQRHVTERGTTIAVQWCFLIRQQREHVVLVRVVVTAILTGPARPTKVILESFRHAVCTFSVELRRALDVCKGLLWKILEIEVLAVRLLDLALKRVQTVCQLLDVAGICQIVAL